jgi:hypothetical protein
LNGVAAIGVAEHLWRHTRRGDKYVTVIIDLTPVRQDRRSGATALSESGHRHTVRHHDYAIQAEVPGAVAAARYTAHAAT